MSWPGPHILQACRPLCKHSNCAGPSCCWSQVVTITRIFAGCRLLGGDVRMKSALGSLLVLLAGAAWQQVVSGKGIGEGGGERGGGGGGGGGEGGAEVIVDMFQGRSAATQGPQQEAAW